MFLTAWCFIVLTALVSGSDAQEASSSDVTGTGSHVVEERANCLGATCGRQEELQSWLGTLFNGIKSLPTKGEPVTIVTFGPSAYATLLGNTDKDVVMAVAGMGEGKVAVFGTPEYVENLGGTEKNKSLKKLHKNLRAWLTNSESAGNRVICKPTDSASLASCLEDGSGRRVLVWTGGDWPSAEEGRAVTEWVGHGNALVHAVDMTTWLENNKVSVMNMGFYHTLLAAGLAYDDRKVKSDNKFSAKKNAATITKLASLNLIEVASSLTYENVKDNIIVNYLQRQMKQSPQLYPLGVANKIWAPFVEFALATEHKMLWPQAKPEDPKEFVPASESDHAMFELYYVLATANLWRAKAPFVDHFPGDIADPPATEQASFVFNSEERVQFFSTGYYLLPGQEMTITIENEETDDTWADFQIIIGSHTDTLSKLDMLARWPTIKRTVKLVDRQMTVSWMFGGLVTVKPPEGKGSHLKLNISGVIPVPYLDLDDPASIAAWPTRRLAPGLVADLRGRRLRITIPSEGVRALEEPWLVMTEWDDMVKKSYGLIDIPWSQQRYQWITVDLQLTAGVMHSGYPLVGRLLMGDPNENIYVFNGEWANHWGTFHEIGHNLQQREWTWGEVTEITCNIFAMLHMERMAGQTEWPMPKLREMIEHKNLKKWFKSSTSTSHDLSKAGILSYAQLIRDFGWGCLKGVFQSYNRDLADDSVTLPEDTLGEQQEWIIRYSQTVGYNLCPLFDFWKWDITPDTRTKLASLFPYFPDDIITQSQDAATHTAAILESYPDVLRIVDVTPRCPTYNF